MLTPTEIDALAHKLDQSLPNVWGLKIENLTRIHGGASRETYSFDAVYDGPDGPTRRGLILRRDPVDSLIDTERALEFAAYRSFHRRGAPVPEAILLDTDPAVMGSPYFVMARIDGGTAASPFAPEPFGEHREAIGRQFFAYLGAIAAVDPYDTELPGVVETPDPADCWRRELDYWAKVIATDQLEPQPIAAAAIRRLRAQPPPAPERLAVVHGDYRNGNFLHDGAGRILAILDWEMAHIGDPLEDLAWALDPMWAQRQSDSAAGLISRGEAIALWEAASGRAFDPGAFAWWSLFASVKGLAIWISSSKALMDGKNTDPVLAFSGWYCTARHNQLIAQRLAKALPGSLG